MRDSTILSPRILAFRTNFHQSSGFLPIWPDKALNIYPRFTLVRGTGHFQTHFLTDHVMWCNKNWDTFIAVRYNEIAVKGKRPSNWWTSLFDQMQRSQILTVVVLNDHLFARSIVKFCSKSCLFTISLFCCCCCFSHLPFMTSFICKGGWSVVAVHFCICLKFQHFVSVQRSRGLTAGELRNLVFNLIAELRPLWEVPSGGTADLSPESAVEHGSCSCPFISEAD